MSGKLFAICICIAGLISVSCVSKIHCNPVDKGAKGVVPVLYHTRTYRM